ncbi:unnamed protein product [Closterium sp. Naga37s-1]|nr:unnamed protein product [Closterium sp. Naga37s-1]
MSSQAFRPFKGVVGRSFQCRCGHCKRLAPEWERLAAAFRASVYVHIAQVDCDAHKELCSKFGVSGYPTLKWFPRNSLTPETYTGDREAEKLLEFANQKSGSRAAALPAGKPSLVVEVTPDNFTEIVKDKTKHVLLEFYAPWCGMCKSLAPDYEALAETFQYEPDIVIAKFDADKYKGTVEKYKIKGYPELRWYPKNNKKGEPYKTSRNLQPLIDFVNAKANTLRKKGGLLDDDVGRIKDLDKIAVKYALSSKEQRVQLRTQMSNTIDFLDAKKDPYAEIYMKIMDHIDSNERYLADEYARVERMLKTPLSPAKIDQFTPLSPAKIDQFTVHKHILTALPSALTSQDRPVHGAQAHSHSLTMWNAVPLCPSLSLPHTCSQPLSPAKIDQFTVRKHILTAFLEFDEEEVAIS